MADSSASPIYRPVSTQRLYEGVVRQIVQQVVQGALEPGACLPSEFTLAQQFGVSRTVIREAMRILAGKGLVAVKHGSGMQIQPPEQWNVLDPLILFEQLRSGHDQSFLNDLLELRRIVETEVAALAAQRRSEEDIRTLHEQIDSMRAVLDDPKAYTRLDVLFHETIMNIARNRLLAQTLRPASQALFLMRLISSQRPGGPALSERGHEQIVTAIESGDPQQARSTLLQHILQFEDDIRTTLAAGITESLPDIEQELGV
ncbi:MAG: FadR family transcriptional regulator [Ktedonobacteraceae bacterium]|nr:FadR family transcriptional regulator [Ktedonobacteraceae bacterium]